MRAFLIIAALYSIVTVNSFAQEDFQSPKLEKNWELKGFDKPSCILFDSKNEVFYIANLGKISGLNKPNEDGYISTVSKDGTLINNFWIKGLISPSDMVIFDKYLYVADMTNIVLINIEDGIVLLKTPIKGARYLNCITADKDTAIYVSDMLTKKIYLYKAYKTTEIMDANEIGFVTAFAATSDKIYCAGKEDIYLFDPVYKYFKTYIKKTSNVTGLCIIDDEQSLYTTLTGTLFMVNRKKQEILLNKPEITLDGFAYIKDNKTVVLTSSKSNGIFCYTLKPL
jgi:hypothetical protein